LPENTQTDTHYIGQLIVLIIIIVIIIIIHELVIDVAVVT